MSISGCCNNSSLSSSTFNLQLRTERHKRAEIIHKNENPTMYEDIKKEVVSIKNSAKEYILNT